MKKGYVLRKVLRVDRKIEYIHRVYKYKLYLECGHISYSRLRLGKPNPTKGRCYKCSPLPPKISKKLEIHIKGPGLYTKLKDKLLIVKRYYPEFYNTPNTTNPLVKQYCLTVSEYYPMIQFRPLKKDEYIFDNLVYLQQKMKAYQPDMRKWKINDIY